MSSKQLTIPGLELPPEPVKKPKAPASNSYKKRIEVLEARVLNLELELTLLQIQLEKEDKGHA